MLGIPGRAAFRAYAERRCLLGEAQASFAIDGSSALDEGLPDTPAAHARRCPRNGEHPPAGECSRHAPGVAAVGAGSLVLPGWPW
jgi:hypothetical protein